jgi:hypothetical protein
VLAAKVSSITIFNSVYRMYLCAKRFLVIVYILSIVLVAAATV